jgi:glycosyltransferase involved in cell wall biosynthesis
VELIPSAVDPSRGLRDAGEARRATRGALEAAGDSVVVLALASLVRRKGIDVLLDALARIADPGVVAWIAGDGPDRAGLEAQASRLGLSSRVRFLGRREDSADLLAGCDLLALPSRREGLGVSALEAMAARRPVVASRVGGLADAVVDGRTGLLVAPDDPEALRLAIARLASDGDLRRRLGEAGPSRLAEGFLAPQMVLAYEKLYRSVLEERKKA